jgi:hypothetical protein
MNTQQTKAIPKASWLGWLFVTFVHTMVLGWHVLSHQTLNSVDGMYHIRYAWLYRTKGVFTDFPWMKFSIASELWTDHHFLYHLLLYPFTWGDLTFGLKLASVVFASLALSVCMLYLLAHRIKHAWLAGLVLLLASDFFLFRVTMARSISLSLIFLVVALWCFERKKNVGLFVVSFLYIWSYQTAIVLLPMACCAVALDRLFSEKWDAKPLLYTAGGLLFGMAIHPFSPDTFTFFYFHFFPAFPGELTRTMVSIPEWSGQSLSELLQRNAPALLLGVLVPLLLAKQWRRWLPSCGLLLIGTWALLLVSFKAARMLEYGVPFAVLLGARLLHIAMSPTDQDTGETTTPILSWNRMTKGGLVLMCLVSLGFGYKYHRDFHRHAFDINPHMFRKAAHWLQQNTPPKSTVYHTDWAGFSYLFFHNTHNTYLSGLSPLFFYAWKPKLYRSYRAISRGQSRRPAYWIQKLFRSRYVILAKRRANRRLYIQLMRSPLAVPRYEDKRCVIFVLRSAPPTSSRKAAPRQASASRPSP